MKIVRFGYEADAHMFNTVADCEQYVFSFENGLGASVIRGTYTFGGRNGLWELAVLDADGDITYATPVTDDVIGHLTEEKVAEALRVIASLPKFDLASKATV